MAYLNIYIPNHGLLKIYIFQTMAYLKYIYSKPWPPSNIYIPNHGLLQIYIFQTMAYFKYIYSKPWPP